MRAPRIACLVPSATDIAAALDLEIVGVSHECDHPRARGIPVLTRSVVPAMHPGGPDPAAIDRQVSAAAASGAPLYLVDHAALAALALDLVITQSICDVCAARADACDLPAGAAMITLDATDLAGLVDDVRRVAGAAGVVARGEACVAAIAARHAAAIVRPIAGRPRVLALEWGAPPFLGGHWIPELVALAGGEHLLSGTGHPSRRADWAEIAGADPDVIVFMPCGYTLADAVDEARRLRLVPAVRALRCVREGRLWATHATALFSRCTPESVSLGAEVLAAIVRDEAPAPELARRVLDPR